MRDITRMTSARLFDVAVSGRPRWAIALLALTACGTTEPSPVATASIVISPRDTTVLSGSRYVLSVTPLDVNGRPVIPAPRLSYIVDRSDIAMVDGSGNVSAVRAGTAAITVRIDGSSNVPASISVVRVGRDVGNP